MKKVKKLKKSNTQPSRIVPRIESLYVKNFRALKNIELTNITPLTVFLGPNGSGKSTLFDVFAFLSDCFTGGLRKAWDKRGRFKELRTRGSEGPILIELQYRETPESYLITYHLEIDESSRGTPIVSREWMRWKRGHPAAPFHFLNYRKGKGEVVSGEVPESKEKRSKVSLSSPEVLAVNTLGQLAENPRVNALMNFITGWHLSFLSANDTRGNPEAGPEERLSRTGDNLPNVIQYLKEQHPNQLINIFEALKNRVPRLEKFDAEILQDGRLLLLLKDAPFERPILARYASDGTLKLLAYLVLLYDPEPPPLIGIEEPENFLHPKLLYELSEECKFSTEKTQLLVTTHSPFFIESLKPEQVRVLYRNNQGYTEIKSTSKMPGVKEFIEAGANLGELWMEGHFNVGDPYNP